MYVQLTYITIVLCLLLSVSAKLHLHQRVCTPVFKDHHNIIHCTSNAYNMVVISAAELGSIKYRKMWYNSIYSVTL